MIFEESFAELKPSAVLRNSDRRKLKKRIIDQYKLLDADVVEVLAPEGTRSAHFATSTGMRGVRPVLSDVDLVLTSNLKLQTLYISSAFDFKRPLWFTLENAEDDLPGDLQQMLIPTLYTLAKCSHLLPVIQVPDNLLPAIQRGGTVGLADVLSSTSDLATLDSGSLVNICDIAVGRMVVHGSEIGLGHEGVAVEIIHAVGDVVHKMGSGTLAPPMTVNCGVAKNALPGAETPSPTSPSLSAASLTSPNQSALPLSTKEVDGLLNTAVLIAIRSCPLTSLPIATSLFYSTYILPCRPAKPTLSTSTPVDIKHSSFKSLAAFLKIQEKRGLLALKTTRNGDMVTMLNNAHPEAERLDLESIETVAEAQEELRRKEEEERGRLEEAKVMKVVRLWKPVMKTKAWFEASDADPAALYSEEDLRRTLDQNVSATHFIDVPTNTLIHSALDHEKDPVGEQCSRDEAVKRLQRNMDAWYSVNGNSRYVHHLQNLYHSQLTKCSGQGELEPIHVASVVRRRAKQVTLVTRFEPFGIDAKSLAEELKPLCAGSTSVNPIPDSEGKSWEVMVQGRQLSHVVGVLMSHGVPKEWIETDDSIEK